MKGQFHRRYVSCAIMLEFLLFVANDGAEKGAIRIRIRDTKGDNRKRRSAVRAIRASEARNK